MNATEQKAIAIQFGAAYTPTEPDDMAGVALSTLSVPPLNALRHPPGAGASGWYIWGGTELSSRPDFFQPLHVEHLTEHCPEIVPYLGLAPGWRVLLASTQREVWFDAKLLAV